MKNIAAATVLTFSLTLLSANESPITDKRTTPAKTSTEATTIGTPDLGANIYGTFPDETTEIFCGTVLGDTLPVAQLKVLHSVPVKSKTIAYERGLRDNGDMAVTDITLSYAPYLQKAWVSLPDSAIVINYNEELPLYCTLVLTASQPFEVKSFDDWITLKSTTAGGTPYCTMLKVIPGKGNITTNPDGSLALNYMHGATLLITSVGEKNAAPGTEQSASRATDKARMRLMRASLKPLHKLYASRKDKAPAAVSFSNFSSTSQLPEPEATPALITNADSDIAAGEVIIGADTLDISLADAEALVHAKPGRIELLPDLPAGWGKGMSNELHIRGGFILLFEWQDYKIIGGTITYSPSPWEGAESITFDLHVNGTVNHLTMKTGETLPLENFIDLVRPFIQ